MHTETYELELLCMHLDVIHDAKIELIMFRLL